MADYHSLLTRAVANLPSGGTSATRDAIYNRARKALLEQLRSLRPPLPESDIAREANALDAAIAKIEGAYGRQDAAPASTPSPPAAPPPSPRPAASAPPSLPVQRPSSPAEPKSAPMAASAAPAPSPGPPRPQPQLGSPAPRRAKRVRSTERAAASAGRGAAGAASRRERAARRDSRACWQAGSPHAAGHGVLFAESGGARGRRSEIAAPVPRIEERRRCPRDGCRTPEMTIPAPPHDLAKAARSPRVDEVHASAAPPVVATRPDEPVQWAAAPEVPGEFDRPGAGARQDSEGQRPVAPGIDPAKPKPWLWIAAAVVLGVVLAVAGAAILMRQKPQDLALRPPVEAAEPPAPQPQAKIAERVDAAPPNPAAAPPASEPKADQPSAQGAAAPPTPAAESPSPPAAPAPSAGRAAMLVASADNPQKPVVSLGSTVWSLIPAAPGQPATVGVKAEADIPDLKMHATMTLRKNTDPTLQATHTIDLKFSFAEGAPITGFKDVGLPQMRKEDSTAAEALTSVKVKISDVYFLIALAKGDADTARNLDLMQTRAWFDFPLLLNDDRIAKVVFQKSPEGEAMLEKAFEAWK